MGKTNVLRLLDEIEKDLSEELLRSGNFINDYVVSLTKSKERCIKQLIEIEDREREIDMEKARVLEDLENIDNNKELVEFIDRNSELMINKYIDLIIYDIDNGVEIERNKKAILLSMKGGK